jgi:Right handed beta helix region
MPTTFTSSGKRRGRSPRLAIGLSLLVFAAVLAGALYLPGWLASTPPAPPVPPGIDAHQVQLAQARQQADLVVAEDNRVLTQLRGIPWNGWPYRDRAHGMPTMILTARPVPYTLDSLLILRAARRVDANTVDLINSVVIGPGARLVLHAPDITLRMISTPTGFTSLVAWKGPIEITGTPDHPVTLTSWDPASNSPDHRVTDGRAYVRVTGSTLRTDFAAFTHLGFWSGRTGGLAITGNDTALGGGSITHTTAHHNHYGLFGSDTHQLTVGDSTFGHAAADGILLHQRSTEATIYATTTHNNTGSGIVANRGASDVTLRNITAELNGADGVRFDGRPLADRPGAAGVSLDGQRGFRLYDSSIGSNTGNGVLIWDADDTTVTGTVVTNNADGIVVRDQAHRAQISANTIITSAEAAIAARDGATDITIDHNAIAGADTGIQLRAAQATVHDNTITAARSHGISIQGAAHGSTAHTNVLAGSGPSGLDLARLDTGAVVTTFNNSQDQWQVTKSFSDRLHQLFGNHPLLAIWTPLLLLSLAASLLTRRHRRRSRPAHPYPDYPTWSSSPDPTGGDELITAGSDTPGGPR